MPKMNGDRCVSTKEKDGNMVGEMSIVSKAGENEGEVGVLGGGEGVAEFQRPKPYTVAWFLHSAPWVDPRPMPESPTRKRGRDESDEETGSGAEDIWVVESLCGLKMKLKRQRVSSVLPEHHEVFKKLLGKKISSNPLPFSL